MLYLFFFFSNHLGWSKDSVSTSLLGLGIFFAPLVTCKFNMTGWTESLNEVTLAPIPFPWIGDLGSVLRRRGTEQDSNDQAVKKYWNSIIRDEG